MSVGSKFAEFLISFFKTQVSFSSQFASFFSSMANNSSVLFWLKHNISSTKIAGIKIHQIPHDIFRNKSQIFFKLCITLQCHETKLFCIFSIKTLYALDKGSPSKPKFLDFWLLTWKLIKFLISFFQATRQYCFKFCITIQCRGT